MSATADGTVVGPSLAWTELQSYTFIGPSAAPVVYRRDGLNFLDYNAAAKCAQFEWRTSGSGGGR